MLVIILKKFILCHLCQIHNRSLTTLSISQNSITNEAIFELKEAFIVNNQISSLFLAKTKLSDEGVVAIAEYIAETTSLNRLDLRDNDIRVGGLMALFSSLKINNSLSRLDVDREPRKEHVSTRSVILGWIISSCLLIYI